jgi:hypothetical protein
LPAAGELLENIDTRGECQRAPDGNMAHRALARHVQVTLRRLQAWMGTQNDIDRRHRAAIRMLLGV